MPSAYATCRDRLVRTQASLEVRKAELEEARGELADTQQELASAREALRMEIEAGGRVVRELAAEVNRGLALAGERAELGANDGARWVVHLFPLLFPAWVRALFKVEVQ